MHYILLHDQTSHRQRMIRSDHISAVEVNMADQTAAVFLLGGQELRLSREESRELVEHVKAHMHPHGKA